MPRNRDDLDALAQRLADRNMSAFSVEDYVIPELQQYEEREYYFCGTQTKVYIGDVWIDDLVSISVVKGQNKLPVYGYDDQYYQGVAKGNVLVQGTFSVYLRNYSYMQSLMAKYAEKHGLSPDISTYPDFTDPWWDTLAEQDDVYAAREAAIWGTGALPFPDWNNRRADEFDYVYGSDIAGVLSSYIGEGFNMMISHGEPTTPHATATIIEDVHINQDSMVVASDGTPIAIQYEFFARDVKDTGKTEIPESEPETEGTTDKAVILTIPLRDLELPEWRHTEGGPPINDDISTTTSIKECATKYGTGFEEILAQYKGCITQIDIVNEWYQGTATHDPIISSSNVDWVTGTPNEEEFFEEFILQKYNDSYTKYIQLIDPVSVMYEFMDGDPSPTIGSYGAIDPASPTDIGYGRGTILACSRLFSMYDNITAMIGNILAPCFVNEPLINNVVEYTTDDVVVIDTEENANYFGGDIGEDHTPSDTEPRTPLYLQTDIVPNKPFEGLHVHETVGNTTEALLRSATAKLTLRLHVDLTKKEEIDAVTVPPGTPAEIDLTPNPGEE